MVDALLNQTNLWDSRKKALSTYSGGMKQRFGIAQALLANPKLIIVDEPTAGLDPAERNRFLNLLSSIGSNVTVILSTHIVEDVRELCPRMAIISNGELLLEGAPNEALEALRQKIWSKVVSTDDRAPRAGIELQRRLHPSHRRTHEVRVYSDIESRRRLPPGRFQPGRCLLPQPLADRPRNSMSSHASGSSSPSSSSSGSRAFRLTSTSLSGSPSVSSASPAKTSARSEIPTARCCSTALRQHL